mmetsp:Transcript_43962/g.71257  ORF Transcript_43962/g.71257 Transcript_43962/m.71257 type:complete len:257 (+) Transcript_43962:112-882(+)
MAQAHLLVARSLLLLSALISINAIGLEATSLRGTVHAAGNHSKPHLLGFPESEEGPRVGDVVSRQILLYPWEKRLAVLLMAVVTFGTAVLYRWRKQWPPADPDMQGFNLRVWSSGPFDCFQDIPISCWSCFCPAIRWADSMAMIGQVGFWLGLTVFVVFNLLSSGGTYGICAWVTACAVFAFFRQRFRRGFDMEGQGSVFAFCGDCCFYIFCTPCAVAQEARHVELAAKADHSFVTAQRPKSEVEQSASPEPLQMS